MFTEDGPVAHEKSGRSLKNGVFEPLQATPTVDVQVPTVVGNAMFWVGGWAGEASAVVTRIMNNPRMMTRVFISPVYQIAPIGYEARCFREGNAFHPLLRFRQKRDGGQPLRLTPP